MQALSEYMDGDQLKQILFVSKSFVCWTLLANEESSFD